MFDLLISPFARIGGLILAIVALFGFGYYKGYSGEKQRYNDFKAQIEAQAKTQEIINQNIIKRQDIVTKGISDEYKAKLSAVRNFYSGVRPPSTDLSAISKSPIGTDAETAYPILVRQCSETTLQLVSLQDWIKKVQ